MNHKSITTLPVSWEALYAAAESELGYPLGTIVANGCRPLFQGVGIRGDVPAGDLLQIVEMSMDTAAAVDFLSTAAEITERDRVELIQKDIESGIYRYLTGAPLTMAWSRLISYFKGRVMPCHAADIRDLFDGALDPKWIENILQAAVENAHDRLAERQRIVERAEALKREVRK